MSQVLRIAMALFLTVIAAACESLAPEPEAPSGPSFLSDPRFVTCAEWRAGTDELRETLASALIGDSPALLRRIRSTQVLPVGTERRVVVQAVIGSLSKNCEILLPRSPTLGQLMEGLYGPASG